MIKHISFAALVFGVALASLPAFAQTHYGRALNDGGMADDYSSATPAKPLYNSATPAAPATPHYGRALNDGGIADDCSSAGAASSCKNAKHDRPAANPAALWQAHERRRLLELLPRDAHLACLRAPLDGPFGGACKPKGPGGMPGPSFLPYVTRQSYPAGVAIMRRMIPDDLFDFVLIASRRARCLRAFRVQPVHPIGRVSPCYSAYCPPPSSWPFIFLPT